MQNKVEVNLKQCQHLQMNLLFCAYSMSVGMPFKMQQAAAVQTPQAGRGRSKCLACSWVSVLPVCGKCN